MKRAGWLLLLFWGLPAYSQTSQTAAMETFEPTDFFIFTGALDYSRSYRGGGGSLDWVHGDERGRTYTAGISAFSLDDGRWIFGKGGVAFRAGAKGVLQGLANVGRGRSAGTGFDYQIYSGEFTYEAISRLYVRWGQEYLKIGETRGSLFKPGVIFLPARLVTVDVGYTHSAGGNFRTEFVSGRLDVATRPVGFLGGFAAGHTIPEAVNVIAGKPPKAESLREGFVGFRVPLYQAELTVVSDFLNLASAQRRSFALSLKVPLQSKEPKRR